MLQFDLFEPWQVLLFFCFLTLVIFIRYLILAGAYHYTFYTLLHRRLAHRIIDHQPFQRRQLHKEIFWSAVSAFIFAAFAIGLFLLWNQGWTAVYTDLNAYPLWYFVGSIFLVLFIQDTYYYWIHRAMHHPRIYRKVHKVHHDSVHTSVFTSFSFHPWETLLQVAILPVIVMVLPLHIYAIIIILTLMTFSAMINHAGVEIYPSGKVGRWLSKWIIGATHHDHHHRKFLTNYGLYFTFWDRWMGTETEVRDPKRAAKVPS